MHILYKRFSLWQYLEKMEVIYVLDWFNDWNFFRWKLRRNHYGLL